MKKMSMILVLALIISVLSMSVFTVSAVAPEWTYQCAKSVYSVTVDGKIDGNEWDDAVELIANNDSEIFKKYGFWQNTASEPIPSSTLSVTYKVKWDETNLYILEVRNDKFFLTFPDSGPEPWNHSGTLFFLSYDANDFNEPDGEGTYEIFWVTQGSEGKPLLSGRYGTGKTLFYEGDDQMKGWVTGGSKSGETYTFEAAIPWKTMQDSVVFPAPAEGVKIRFTPIISAFHSTDAEQFGEGWNQLDFYVNTASPDDVTGEGALELTGPIVTVSASSNGFGSAEETAAGKSIIGGAQFIDGGAHFGEESPANMFDGNTETKYCAGESEGMMPFWATWQYDQAYTADRLILATANDNESNPGRRMADGWTLSGSNDGSSWSVIYTGTANDVEDVNYTFYGIDLNNSAAYQYYKMEGAAPADGNVIQYSEIALCGTASGSAMGSGGGENPHPSTSTPDTGDNSIIFLAVMILAAATFVLAKKRIVKAK